MVTYDLLASVDSVKSTIQSAQEYLEDGEVQRARPLVASLASEIVVSTTSIPLATYPEAIAAAAPLIEEGKLDEAKIVLYEALTTLVVTEDVLGLPTLRAQALLAKAESLAEMEERSAEENETLTRLLADARTQLELAEILGYGTREAFAPLYQELDRIEGQTSEVKGGKGWFDELKKQLSDLI